MTRLTRLCSWSFKRVMWVYLRRFMCMLCTLFSINLPLHAQIILSAELDSLNIRNFAAELAQQLPLQNVQYVPRSQLQERSEFAADTRLILLGPALLDWRLQLKTSAPATLIMQVSRVQAYQRITDQQPERLTFLWSDPPIDRQIALLKTMLPGRKNIGLLYSNNSQFLLKEIEQAMQAHDLTLHTYYWSDSYDARSLARLLSKTDVLFGIDDAHIYNPSTIKSILLSSYARKQALIGPTAAFIKAGSLSSTYSDRDDWLRSLQRILQTPTGSWPRSIYPEDFKIMFNSQVARSLGVDTRNRTGLVEQLKQFRTAP